MDLTIILDYIIISIIASMTVNSILRNYAKKYKIYCGFHQVEPEPKSIDALSKKGFSMIAYSVDFRMLDVMARSPFK